MKTREFFEGLESRVDSSKTAGVNNSYLFDIEGEGQWKVDVSDGSVSVTEGGGDADVTITSIRRDVRAGRLGRPQPDLGLHERQAQDQG